MAIPEQESHARHSHPAAGDAAEPPDRARDPVCGMIVDPHATSHRREHAGRSYYFCCAGCAAKFSSDPDKYLAGSDARRAAPLPPGITYTCPMHAQIRQVGPGSCPICGMALEP